MFSSITPTHGFRLSFFDALVLLLASGLTWWVHASGFGYWWLLPCVVGHFFLFCNVFRIRRAFELWWSVLFLINVVFWMLQLRVDAFPVLIVQLPITAAFVIAEIRLDRYHGIFSKRSNSKQHEL